VKKRLKYAALGFLTVLGVIAVLSQFIAKEPVHEGKSATEWIQEFGKNTPQGAYLNRKGRNGGVITFGKTEHYEIAVPKAGWASVMFPVPTPTTNFILPRCDQVFGDKLDSSFYCSELADPAAVAIRALGPKAVPALSRAVTRKESCLDEAYRKLWDKCPPSLKTNRLAPPFSALQLRRNAAILLGQMGHDGTNAIPAMIRALEDTDSQVRYTVAEALGMQGRAALAAVPTLIKALDSSDSRLSLEAFVALDRIGDATHDVKIADWAKQKLGEVGLYDVIKARDLFGPVAARALGGMMHSRDATFQVGVLNRIGRVGPTAAFLTGEIIPFLSSPEFWLRYRAVYALSEIGHGAGAAIPSLEKLKDDHDGMVALAASNAIVRINMWNAEGQPKGE